MNLTTYPTPETDEMHDRCRGIAPHYAYDALCRTLERRLALCRAALAFYAADTEDDDGRTATEALAATAPK